jgi:hypothetical protein
MKIADPCCVSKEEVYESFCRLTSPSKDFVTALDVTEELELSESNFYAQVIHHLLNMRKEKRIMTLVKPIEGQKSFDILFIRKF